MIYEGTNGIQALDLLGRKILRDNAKTLSAWVNEINQHASSLTDHEQLSTAAKQIETLCGEWMQLTAKIGQAAQSNMDEIGAAAFDFLMYSGYVSVAHVLLKMAEVALSSDQPEEFKMSKVQVLNFYTARILPRTLTHSAAILSGNSNLECTEFEIN